MGKTSFFFLTKPEVIKAGIRASISLQVADTLVLKELSGSFSFCYQQRVLSKDSFYYTLLSTYFIKEWVKGVVNLDSNHSSITEIL